MQDWLWSTAADLGRAIGRGEIDPVALAEAYLDAIEGHDLRARIYARTTPERAMAEARAASARAKAGHRLSALDGVPVSWKDLFDSKDVSTEAGSLLLKGRTPDRDAAVLARATRAGMVCLGKTHMSELAFSGLGYNPKTGWPPCVNDPGAVSGGSSSGAAASVAHGLAPIGIGSDTGGSVRVPSAWNDLVGLKTTHGSLPMAGVVPLCPSFDTLGPLARSVEDAGLMWSVMADRRAPDLAGASLSGRRLLWLTTVARDDVEDAVAAGVADAVARLRDAGAEVVEGEVPCVAEAMPLSGTVFAPEAYGHWRETIEAHPELMYERVRERFRGGRDVSAPDFVAGWRRLEELRAEYRAATAGFDAVILPTAPILPPNAERLVEDEAYYVEKNLLTLRNTRIGNLMGLPGLTLPTGAPSVGLLLQGGAGSEARLLRIGAASEAALTGKTQGRA